MKNKKDSNGIVIGIVIIFLMFLSYAGNNLSELYNADYTGDVNLTAYYYALINVILNLFCIGLVPFICKKINQTLYLKHIKFIYILNAIVWIILSIPLFSIVYQAEENGGFGLIGTTVFSIAVYNLLRRNTKLNNSSINIEENNAEQFKCDNCGALVKESDTICPKCGEKFDDEEEEIIEELKEKSNMDQKYSDLTKLKKLLDKDIISKEEFEKEKKKILNNE